MHTTSSPHCSNYSHKVACQTYTQAAVAAAGEPMGRAATTAATAAETEELEQAAAAAAAAAPAPEELLEREAMAMVKALAP